MKNLSQKIFSSKVSRIGSVLFTFLFLLTTTSQAYAAQENYSCSGAVHTEGQPDGKEAFDIVLDTNTGVINGYPIRITMGCMFGEESQPRKCSVNESVAQCECKSTKGSGVVQFSKNTLILKTTTFAETSDTKSVMLSGDFSCKKIEKKP